MYEGSKHVKVHHPVVVGVVADVVVDVRCNIRPIISTCTYPRHARRADEAKGMARSDMRHKT